MVRRLLMSAVCVLFVVAACGLALAEDLWDPPWEIDPAYPTTYQRWDFPTDLYNPVEVDNPFGDPVIEWPETATPQTVEDWTGMDIMTWHVGGPDGSTSPVSIWVPNDPTPNEVKKIFWQMTSDKSATPTGSPPSTQPPGTSVPTSYPAIGHGGTWYTYNGMIEIKPNPPGAWIIFDLVSSTNIEEIVIKTTCVPEPGTLGLLVAGGVLAAIRRRRR